MIAVCRREIQKLGEIGVTTNRRLPEGRVKRETPLRVLLVVKMYAQMASGREGLSVPAAIPSPGIRRNLPTSFFLRLATCIPILYIPHTAASALLICLPHYTPKLAPLVTFAFGY